MSVYIPSHSQGNYGNITLGAAGASTVTMSGAGGSGGSGSILMASGTGTGTTWANNTNTKISAKGQLHLDGEDADLIMNGISLKDTLNGITDRLAILQPKPELLEKYENLREAYEHYKTLEALLHQDNDDK